MGTGKVITDNHGSTYEQQGNKNIANGYVGLDSTRKIPASYLPNSALQSYVPIAVLGTGRVGLCALGIEYAIIGWSKLGQSYLV